MRMIILDEYLRRAYNVILFGIVRRTGLERFAAPHRGTSLSPPPPSVGR